MPYKNKDNEKAYRKKYEAEHKEVIAARKKRYRAANKDGIRSKRKANKDKENARNKIYRDAHKGEDKVYRLKRASITSDYNKTYTKNKRRTDPQFKLSVNLRSRLYQALKGRAKAGSAVRDLGCSIEELKAHLEKQFQSGMTWDNWSPTGWHIDHIKPLASFDLTDREQFLKACHYTNLQPLWAEENMSKGDR